MAPDRGSCYAGRMSLVATLAMLMLMPAGGASIPAVKSAQCPPGYIVSGGYCTPVFRPAPGLRGPPFPGNGICAKVLRTVKPKDAVRWFLGRQNS